MRTVLKAFIALCLVVICAGGAYAHKVKENAKFETVFYHEVLRSGDTFNGVIQQYYNAENQNESWDEWQTRMKQRNKRLFFYENGKPRHLRKGDIICIEVREKVKE